MKMKILSLVTLFFVMACTQKQSQPQFQEDSYNQNADPSSLGYFSLPAETDARLKNKEELPDAQYSLIKIQTFTISWETKAAVSFEQILSVPASPENGDQLNFSVVEKANNGRDYRLSAQVNLPLNFSVNSSKLKFGTVKEYWNQVFTTHKREWALNTKPNATAINPSIDEIVAQAPIKRGVYTQIPNRGTKNTVFVVLQDNGNVSLYLKTQLKSETQYIHLVYETTSPTPPPPPRPITQPQPITQETQKTIAEYQSELSELFKQLPEEVELETINGGDGDTASFFGSGEGEKTGHNSVERLKFELEQIRKLIGIIQNSSGIQVYMKIQSISKIKIINPYQSENLPGISRGKKTNTLLLQLGMNEIEIINLLNDSDKI